MLECTGTTNVLGCLAAGHYVAPDMALQTSQRLLLALLHVYFLMFYDKTVSQCIIREVGRLE